MNKKIILYLMITVLIISLLMRGCYHKTTLSITSPKEKIATVEQKALTTTLFYSGTIQPLKGVTVISPADGVVEEMFFHYGDMIKKDQILLTINSEKFQTDYKNNIMQYVKAKSEFDNAKNQLSQGKFLHDNKLISDDELKMRKTNFYNSQLTLVQTKDVLAGMLKQINNKMVNLYDITIADVDKITQILKMQNLTKRLQVVAPVSGVALLPVKSDNAGLGGKKPLKGEPVKQGDILTLIGDGNGICVFINVSEFDINQLKIGQKVKVTGAAFPDYVLEGTITGVDHQAEVNQSGMPSFSAQIDVPQLTTEQQKMIHVGMSAKVEVTVNAATQIAVPITAVTEKNGETFVNVQNKQTHVFEPIAVKVGQTTADSVVVLAGLHVGDIIST